MSSIHYFPRYSQKENMVTNNTLLLFSRLYNNNTDKFKRLINTILEDSGIELDTTVTFKQQEKGKGSIPDAVIEQESFKVVIETKLYGHQNLQQIEKHFNVFTDEDKQVFLWINKDQISDSYHQEIIESINSFNALKGTNINFASTTFKDICRSCKDLIPEYDVELKELIDDFEIFCGETGLIDNSDTKMRVVLTGATFKQNMKCNIYYAPKERGYQQHKYLGLYKGKAVRAIGELLGYVDFVYDFDTEKLKTVETHLITPTEEQKDMVKKVIIQAKERFGFDISQNHRFFIVNKYFETEYIKPSKGGLMGQKYFDLVDIEGYQKGMTTEEIANLLKNKEWIY